MGSNVHGGQAVKFVRFRLLGCMKTTCKVHERYTIVCVMFGKMECAKDKYLKYMKNRQ